jgi:hypothetical protein
MKGKTDIEIAKFSGITMLLFGLVIAFTGPSLGVAYFMIIYGGLCFLIPHKLFPSDGVISERNSTLRSRVIESRQSKMNWYNSPVFIGMAIFIMWGLQYAIF